LTGYFRSAKLCLVSQAKEDKTFFGIVKRHSPKNKLIKNLNLIRWRSLLYMEGYKKKEKKKKKKNIPRSLRSLLYKKVF
jgi:hypothetical protein